MNAAGTAVTSVVDNGSGPAGSSIDQYLVVPLEIISCTRRKSSAIAAAAARRQSMLRTGSLGADVIQNLKPAAATNSQGSSRAPSTVPPGDRHRHTSSTCYLTVPSAGGGASCGRRRRSSISKTRSLDNATPPTNVAAVSDHRKSFSIESEVPPPSSSSYIAAPPPLTSSRSTTAVASRRLYSSSRPASFATPTAPPVAGCSSQQLGGANRAASSSTGEIRLRSTATTVVSGVARRRAAMINRAVSLSSGQCTGTTAGRVVVRGRNDPKTVRSNDSLQHHNSGSYSSSYFITLIGLFVVSGRVNSTTRVTRRDSTLCLHFGPVFCLSACQFADK